MDPIIRADEWFPVFVSQEIGIWIQVFAGAEKGTHTSRTIMFTELRALLATCQPEASRDDYIRAILDENCLGKRTVATRNSPVNGFLSCMP